MPRRYMSRFTQRVAANCRALSSNNESFSRSATRLTDVCSFAVISSKIGCRIDSVQFARVCSQEAATIELKSTVAQQQKAMEVLTAQLQYSIRRRNLKC